MAEEYRHWDQSYVVDDDPNEWPDTIDGLIAYLEGLRALGYDESDYDDEAYENRNAHFDFIRKATPAEVEAEAAKAVARDERIAGRKREERRVLYGILRAEFGEG